MADSIYGMPRMAKHKVCRGTALPFAATVDECGGKFCPECDQPVGMDALGRIVGHWIKPFAYCECEEGIYVDNDYLCESCRASL